jgi:hypothetical protein
MLSTVPSRELFVFDLGIEDALWSKTMYIFVAFAYVMMAIMFSAKYLHISGEMDKIECDPNFMTFMWMFSWIFGKSAEENIKKCMSHNDKMLVNAIQNPLIDRMNNEKQYFDQKMKVYDSNLIKMQRSYDKSDGRVTNLAIAIQNNILAIKEGMQKIIASAIVQSRMTKGAISVVKTNKANYDGIRKIVDKMP